MNIVSLLPILKWTARISSIVSIGLILLFLIADSEANLTVTLNDVILMLFFPLGVIAGMIFSWYKPGEEAKYSLFALAAFYAMHYYIAGRFPQGSAFFFFVLPSLIFLVYWFIAMSTFFTKKQV